MEQYTPNQVKHMQADLRNFLWAVHKHLNLQEPTNVQYNICEFLQDKSKDRKIITAARGFGKSHISAVYCMWRLWNDPTEQILVVSGTLPRAKLFTSFCQKLIIGMPLLKHLIPEKSTEVWGKQEFSVKGALTSQTNSVTSVGITSQLTGRRATLIVSDDCETLQNAKSFDTREQLLHACEEYEAIVIPDRANQIIYLGTPQSKFSIYKNIKDWGYERRIWTAEVPNSIGIYNNDLAPMIMDLYTQGKIGHPCEPDRFPAEVLKQKKLTYGESSYELQFQLNTELTDEGMYPLKPEQLIVSDKITHELTPEIIHPDGTVEGNMVRYSSKILIIDPAGEGADLCAYCVMASMGGYIYILECGGFQSGYADETLQEFKNICNIYKVGKVVVESNFGDGVYTKLLTKHVRRSIDEIRHSTNKQARIIQDIEPVLNQRRLIIHKGTYDEQKGLKEQKHSLITQMAGSTYEKNCLEHDDMVDVLAMGIAYMSDHLKIDEVKVKARRDDIIRQKRLDDFIAHATRLNGSKSNNRDKFYR